MPPPLVTRRSILQAACGSFGVVLVGCSTTGPEPGPTSSERLTATNSSSPSPSALSFSVEITQPRSDTSPPQFRASLANEGPHSVTVTYGADLLWSVEAGYPDALRVLPTHLVDENPTATPADRCWEYPEHPAIPIPAMETITDISPREKIAQEFVLYNDAEDACYPPGKYAIRDEIEVTGLQGAIDLAVRITVDETGQFTIEGSLAKVTG